MMSFADIVITLAFAACPHVSKFACAKDFHSKPRIKPHDRRTLSISIKQKAMWGNHAASCETCGDQIMQLAFLATTELPVVIDGNAIYFPPLPEDTILPLKISRQLLEKTIVSLDATVPIRNLSNDKFDLWCSAPRSWKPGMKTAAAIDTQGIGIRAGLGGLELEKVRLEMRGYNQSINTVNLCYLYLSSIDKAASERGHRYVTSDEHVPSYINLAACFWPSAQSERRTPNALGKQILFLVRRLPTTRVVILCDNYFASNVMSEVVNIARGPNSINSIDLHNTNIGLRDAKMLVDSCILNGVFFLDLRQTWMTSAEVDELKQYVADHYIVSWLIVLVSSVDLPGDHPDHRADSMCCHRGPGAGTPQQIVMHYIYKILSDPEGKSDWKLNRIDFFRHLCAEMTKDEMLQAVYAVYPDFLELLGTDNAQEIIDLGCTVEEIIASTPELDYKRSTIFGKALGLAIQ